MNSERGLSSKLRRLMGLVKVKRLRDDRRGACHWGAFSRRKLHIRGHRQGQRLAAPSRVVIFQHAVPSVESVARAHLLAAALMPAEPHIRSPFTERLAPPSLIPAGIGLGTVASHWISALRSHS